MSIHTGSFSPPQRLCYPKTRIRQQIVNVTLSTSTHPHSTEAGSGVFAFDLANVIQVFSLDEDRHEQSLHLFRLGNEILERFQQLLQLDDPWIGFEKVRNNVLGIGVDLLQADYVDIGQVLLHEVGIDVQKVVKRYVVGRLRRHVPCDNV